MCGHITYRASGAETLGRMVAIDIMKGNTFNLVEFDEPMRDSVKEFEHGMTETDL